MMKLPLLLLFSLVLTTITGHTVKKTQNEDLAFESSEDVGRQLSEEEGLLKVRMVREAVASQSGKISKKSSNKRRKTEEKTRTLKSRQNDEKEVKKGKIGSLSQRKSVKGRMDKKNKKRKQNSKSQKNKIFAFSTL